MGMIACSPKINGKRTVVSGSCTKKCKYYSQCCEEVGATPHGKFIEDDPTEYELSAGIGHIGRYGDIKIWRFVKFE